MRDDHGHDLTSEPTENELRVLREAAGHVAFAPGFADRVMARRAATRAAGDSSTDSSTDALQYVFVRLAPLAAAAVLVLSTVNLMNASGRGQPILDRLFGLPTVTLASAYTLDGALTSWGETNR
ncbi:hypothetical protein [Gemmatimonas groenlandica]|uniref:Uncharacterized protein n=1 Tax=Gemmatimonas groenlandica TaxID=2732249 RepID=A0A6M4IQ28_9BACT|nr:hypothetical protein [Gemmatimonas groenlandica]QJR36813.1 hypothetical protein HKW67_15455 [Gemmatimonas groenlandica]